MKSIAILLTSALLLPATSFATKRPEPQPQPVRTETVVVEKHRTNRDAILVGVAVGVLATIVFYESRDKKTTAGVGINGSGQPQAQIKHSF